MGKDSLLSTLLYVASDLLFIEMVPASDSLSPFRLMCISINYFLVCRCKLVRFMRYAGYFEAKAAAMYISATLVRLATIIILIIWSVL